MNGEADETVQEQHEPLVEGGEDKPTREESNNDHERLSMEMWETNVGPSGDDKNVKEDHEEFSVEPREQEDVVIKDGFETIQVEMKKVEKKMPKMAMNVYLGRKKSGTMMLRLERNV